MSIPLGPNVRRLIATKMANDAIPNGGGIEDAIKFLSTKEGIIKGARSAADWVKAAILTVKQAAEPNPWIMASDEEIAAHILERIKSKTSRPN